jgi:tetratricopeptide (TPR) repeat protein
MSRKLFPQTAAALIAALIAVAASAPPASAQSGATRPRRVNPQEVTREAQTPEQPAPAARPAAASPARAAAGGDTTRAYTLLQQGQFADAAREAKQVAASNPGNSEAWKIAGFAELGLKQYAEAAADLQKARDLQRAAGDEDVPTADALAQALVRSDQFERALPLLVEATSRPGKAPDAAMLYYRGLAEYRTGKAADAERSFNAAVRADPKNAISLFYLGRIAYERSQSDPAQLDAAVAALNRATTADPRLADAWVLLTYAYLGRAARAQQGPKADADYLNAVRTSDALLRVRADESALVLSGQALVGAKQYVRAVNVLERAAASPEAAGPTLYLLGVAQSRAKNFPKAVVALERAAAKTPGDANVYRELGYAYEVSKQYAKALAAYERGAQLAPSDADFKESAERVRPFAK